MEISEPTIVIAQTGSVSCVAHDLMLLVIKEMPVHV